jgi:phospholipase/carboxylesterase
MIQAQAGPQLVEAGSALKALGLVHRLRPGRGAGPHPCVVMLHGMGGNEDAMWIFASRLPPDWLLLAPRAPHPREAGGFAWQAREPDEWPTLAQFRPSAERILRLIAALPAVYAADPARIYLMGFSQGAAVAITAALLDPGAIAGMAGLVGFVPTACEEQALALRRPLSGLPVFMAAGLKDPMIPLDRSREAAALLSEAGARLDYREYPIGHKLDAAGMRDLAAWWSERAHDAPGSESRAEGAAGSPQGR